MKNHYTPTTEQVKARYVQEGRFNSRPGFEFDEWLAEHDRDLLASVTDVERTTRR